VDSKKAATFTVAFAPPAVGTYAHELSLRVRNNPFEHYRVVLAGECYQDDVTFDGLPGGALDELRFEDARLNEELVATFALLNHSSSKHFKWVTQWDWVEHACHLVCQQHARRVSNTAPSMCISMSISMFTASPALHSFASAVCSRVLLIHTSTPLLSDGLLVDHPCCPPFCCASTTTGSSGQTTRSSSSHPALGTCKPTAARTSPSPCAAPRPCAWLARTSSWR
jgi:hypothetical protein